jgi:hypothetical protein
MTILMDDTGSSVARLSALRDAGAVLALPCSPLYVRARMTPRRIQNFAQMKEDQRWGRTVVRSYPVSMSLESVNACNLRCPGCFTGAGAVGRSRGKIPLPLYRKILKEVGPYLLNLELHNWGEPLLHPDLPQMIGEAHEIGCATTVSTNLSLALPDERLDALVRSGLSTLVVSIDGASQETYERYRKRGRLDLVLDTCRRIADAKRLAGGAGPDVVWSFHAFEYNLHEIPAARALARDRGMRFSVEKGWTIGEEWTGEGAVMFSRSFQHRCWFLWEHATINNDGGVAICAASFFDEDDVGRMGGESEAQSFFSIWNGEHLQDARGLFESRSGATAGRDLACFECPLTVNHELAKLEGNFLGRATSPNEVVNYHWRRGARFRTGEHLVNVRTGRIPG